MLEGHDLRELRAVEDARLPLVEALRAPDGGRYEVLAWRPGRRLVIRTEQHALTKGWRRGRAAQMGARHEAVRSACGAHGLRLARVLQDEFAARHGALCFERMSGRRPRITSAESRQFAHLGACLRALQEAPLPKDFAVHDVASELLVLHERARRNAVALGKSAERVERTIRELRERARSLPPMQLGVCHRDLHDAQILVADDHVCVLDWDLACAADTALDPANLLAHMALRELQDLDGADASGVDACGRALLDGLDRANDELYWVRLRFYQACTFLRLSMLYALRPRWRHLTDPLQTLAERCLAMRHAV